MKTSRRNGSSGPVDYSIVVVTWECSDVLGALVASMNRHLASRPELVVIDNASGDNPRQVVGDWHGPSEFILLPVNVGYGAANNIGVRRARGEAVVLLNPDTELLDSSLDALAAEALHRSALVGPRILNADGSVQPSATGPPTGVWPWIGAFWPGALQPRAVAARTEPWRLSTSTRVASLLGACIAAPRSLLLSLGPFDEGLHLYGDDLDLGLRAAAASVSSYLVPGAARVRHHGSAAARRRFEEGEIAAMMAENSRAVVRRARGARAEARAWRADRVKFAMRAAAKRALGREASGDLRTSRALRRAVSPSSLPAPSADAWPGLAELARGSGPKA